MYTMYIVDPKCYKSYVEIVVHKFWNKYIQLMEIERTDHIQWLDITIFVYTALILEKPIDANTHWLLILCINYKW